MKKEKTTSETSSLDMNEEHVDIFDSFSERLKEEKDHLVTEIKKEIEKGHEYIKNNPTRGALIAFIGGLFLGYIIKR